MCVKLALYRANHVTSIKLLKMCHLMQPDGTLNHVKHMHFAVHRQQDNSDSRAQECEGHALSTKTLRSHLLWNYTVFIVTHSGKAKNFLDCG